MSTERVARLEKYVTDLRARLAGDVPPRHKDSVKEWKQMLEIDIKKTQMEIDRIKK